jgi:hypothetical protein
MAGAFERDDLGLGPRSAQEPDHAGESAVAEVADHHRDRAADRCQITPPRLRHHLLVHGEIGAVHLGSLHA